MGETEVAGQAKVEVFNRESEEPAVVDSFKFQGMDGLAGMACFAERLDEFTRQVFVDENSQETTG